MYICGIVFVVYIQLGAFRNWFKKKSDEFGVWKGGSRSPGVLITIPGLQEDKNFISF